MWSREERWLGIGMSGSEWYVVKDDAAQRDFPCTCPALGPEMPLYPVGVKKI